jgi:hypothetical protein
LGKKVPQQSSEDINVQQQKGKLDQTLHSVHEEPQLGKELAELFQDSLLCRPKSHKTHAQWEMVEETLYSKTLACLPMLSCIPNADDPERRACL